MKEEIFKSKIRAGKRTYFFDIYKASNDSLYLEISESRLKSDGTYDRHNIMIFPEEMKQFKNEIIEIYEKFFQQK